jgi:hypothetical protein
MKTYKVTELSPAQAPRERLSFVDAAGEPRGYCYCCGRVGFKLDRSGQLSRHGFTRPRWAGFTTGACSGTRYTPEETLAIAIQGARADLDRLDALLRTDLRVFAANALRKLERARVAKQSWAYRGKGADKFARTRTAKSLRLIRAGVDECPHGGAPAAWSPTGRRLELTEDRKSCSSWLAELLEVQKLAEVKA